MGVMTAGEISKQVIKEMTLRGFECWRNNNIAVRGRQFIGKLGVSDIAGYHTKTGVALYVEVKAYGDVLSDEQIKFLGGVSSANAFAFIAKGRKEGGYYLDQFKTV